MPKPNGNLRGITDRRLQNSWERQPDTPCLPHGSQLCGLVLGPEDDLEVCAEDLSNFFCALHVPIEKARRNIMGPSFSDVQLQEAGVDVPAQLQQRSQLWCGLMKPSMGNINALAHAQQAHEVMLEQSGGVRADQMLRCGFPDLTPGQSSERMSMIWVSQR